MTQDLSDEVNALRWFHSIDFGNGLVSPGIGQLHDLKRQADAFFPTRLDGKRLLDIGCWDGFYSLEATRRGANVLATDHWVWANHDWASRKTIELVRKHLAPNLEIMDIDVPDLTPATVGVFDVVLFSGVLYHLRNMLAGLEQVSKLTTDMLIVETYIDLLDMQEPAAKFYPGTELNNDNSNWWGPNPACVEAMMHDVGFADVTFTSISPSRGIFHGRRKAAFVRANVKPGAAVITDGCPPSMTPGSQSGRVR